VSDLKNFKINDREITCTPYEPKESGILKNAEEEQFAGIEKTVEEKHIEESSD